MHGYNGGTPIDEAFYRARISGRHNPEIAAGVKLRSFPLPNPFALSLSHWPLICLIGLSFAQCVAPHHRTLP